MRAWLRMWSYRIQENAAPRRPKWAHMLVCPFCRGMSQYVRDQERPRRKAAGYALEQNAATWDLLCPRCASFLDRAAVDRERAERAEAKLAVIAERCKQPDQLLGTQVLVDRDAILAIIGSEEGDSRDG